MVQSHWPEIFPFTFWIKKLCNFSKLPEFVSSHYITECFLFPFRMVSVCFQDILHTSRIFISKGFFSERFPNKENWSRIDQTLSACFPNTTIYIRKAFVMFWDRSGCSESTQITSASELLFQMNQELDECFPNVFRTCMPYIPRMLPEYFSNILDTIHKVDENYFEHAKKIPSLTANMLLEHTECFLNMLHLLSVCFPNTYIPI